jgi:hypothetical protein
MPVPASSISTVNATIAQSAHSERERGDCFLAQGTDEHREDRTVGRCSAKGAEDDCQVRRNRSPMENPQLNRYRPLLGVVGVFKRLCSRVDIVGDAREPGRENVEQCGNAGQQEYRRQCNPDDVCDGIER